MAKIDWSTLPLRKPLAIFAAGLVGGSVVVALWRGCDLPQNISRLLEWFGGLTIAAYYASSTTEAVKGVGTAQCGQSGNGSSSGKNTAGSSSPAGSPSSQEDCSPGGGMYRPFRKPP